MCYFNFFLAYIAVTIFRVNEVKGGTDMKVLECRAIHWEGATATAVYNKTLEQLQHMMWLNPKCKNYTGRMMITTSMFEVREIRFL
jgi:hypothetical protein